ncbi:hypothetical protein AAFF_G00257130 [Aldrovandia affinis]|uniref:LEM domain-containing protein n=1 Tax=Aldrovandia affinis TaxID=143900 RepID=A0AAD7WU23_9TELE|nr:hypothetical protein AAFF_G00257130 [Aldrovandia affinis]
MHSNKKNLATQLCKAVSDGEPRAVEGLLLRGANPNLILRKGVAAVHLAVGAETEKRIRCLKLLLQHGADPNVRSVEDLTPLHVAALWGCCQNLKLLLQNGGDPSLKDQDGHRPVDLAKEQENRKCAQLLQQYQSWDTLEAEEEDLPQFQYSFYRGQGSGVVPGSSCMEESTTASESLSSDCNEGPLSSTRRSSSLNMSGISRPRFSGLSDLSELHVRRTQEWDRDWGVVPSVLSSTRMSAAGSRGFAAPGTLPKLQEGVPLSDCGALQSKDLDISAIRQRPSSSDHVFPHRGDPPCFLRRLSRKSVSFRDVDEFFPAFSAESPARPPHRESDSSGDTTVDFSDYSNFLDSERTATLRHHQGIDVTSPDHVFVFSRDAECASPDLDKTVVGPWLMEERETAEGGGEELSDQVRDPIRPPCGSDGSSSGASQYSSCDSDPYTSALEPSRHHKGIVPWEDEGENKSETVKNGCPLGKASAVLQSCSALPQQPTLPLTPTGTKSLYPTIGDELSDDLLSQGHSHKDDHRSLANIPVLRSTDPSIGVIAEAELPAMMDDLVLCAKYPQNKAGAERARSLETFSDTVPVDRADRGRSEEDPSAGEVMPSSRVSRPPVEVEAEFPLTPSPFVTGRTRSRLSRCSIRTGGSPHTSLSASSLFEDTLPAPTRRYRRINSGRACDRGPEGLGHTPTLSASESEAPLVNGAVWCGQETQSSTLRAVGVQSSQQSDSQADTPFVSGSMADTVILSGSMADTVILEEGSGGSASSSSEDDRAGTSPARTGSDDAAVEGNEFLTDDLSSLNGEGGKEESDPITPKVSRPRPKAEGSWSADDVDSGGDSQSELSSSLMGAQTPVPCLLYASPEPGKDPPATPASGCTPRYSISRLSACHKPQTLANLSYTPGGRPLILDVEEPVEYLYTDVEKGHELIECHVPPTANTSLSSNASTTTSEDTVLYDWRSATLSLGKENHLPQEDAPDTKGLTDKELRRRLKEFGEDPGPINRLTRPVYIQRLRRLQQEPSGQRPAGHSSEYSAEMAAALHTFTLPDCFDLEMALCQQFDQPDQNRKWREGIIKSSFNYLLLDPRVTKNLPYRSQSMTPAECLRTFVSAVFYVGKGKRSRPYSHLYEALEYYRGDKTSKKLCSKVEQILQVWNAGQGVISLHCFQNVIPVEAYTREACMVDAIGLKMLTNQKRGDYYGIVATWPLKQRREMGVHLLYRAMQIFLAEGERQLRPADIRAGQ